MREERAHKRSGEREDGPEHEPDAGRPCGPYPSARPLDLVGKPKQHGRKNDTEDRRQGASKKQLFAEARETGKQQNVPDREIARDGAQVPVQPAGPRKARDGDTGREDDRARKDNAEESARGEAHRQAHRNPRARVVPRHAVADGEGEGCCEGGEEGVTGRDAERHAASVRSPRPPAHNPIMARRPDRRVAFQGRLLER